MSTPWSDDDVEYEDGGVAVRPITAGDAEDAAAWFAGAKPLHIDNRRRYHDKDSHDPEPSDDGWPA